jgi:hypothetical protein
LPRLALGEIIRAAQNTDVVKGAIAPPPTKKAKQ